MEQAGVQLIAQGAGAFDADMKSATNATNTFVDATDKGSGKVNAAGQIMTGALRHLGTIAVDALAQAAKATAAFVGDSINLAGDFEAGMLNFQAVAGKDVDTKGLEQFRDLFIQIGKELPVSTAEVQQAATEMVKGGIDPATIAAGGLRQNIQFAAAAMEGDLVKAAEISAKILGGWAGVGATAAEKADFLTHATDLLARAANASTTDVEGLSLGIFNAQGTARNAGVSFDDLTTSLAALAPRFESSAIAGNSLKNFIIRLQPTTKPAAAAMEDLGLWTEEAGSKFYDAQGKFIGFQAAAQLLHDAVKDLTPEMRQSELQAIFLSDAMGAAAGFAELGAAGYQEMADALENANGVQAAAALKQQGFNTALDNAKGSVEALQITIGTAFLPLITDLLNNYIAPGVNSVTAFAESFSKMIPAIQASEDPFRTFMLAVSVAAPNLTDLVFQILRFTDSLKPAIAEFSRLVDAFSTGGISGLIDAMASDISAALPDIEAALLSWGEAFVDWIAPMIPPALDALADLASQAWGWVKQQAPAWGQQLKAWGKELVDWIAPMIPPMVAELGKMGMQFLGWIGDQAAPLVKKFNDWATSFVAWIPGATVTFLAQWPGMLNKFLDWIGTSAGPLLLKLGDWALSFTEWIIPMIPGFLLTLGDVALALATFIVETAVVLNSKVIEWAIALTSWVGTEAIPRLLKALAGMWTNINTWGLQVEHDIGVKMADVGKSLVAGIESGISAAWSSMVGWLSNKMSGLVDAAMEAIGAGSPAKEFMPVGESIPQGLMAGIVNLLPALNDLINQTGTDMIAALKKNIQKGGDEIRKMMDDLTADVKDIASQINDAIADGFGATASIDRQIAKNLDKFKDIPDAYKQYTEGALQQAQAQAQSMADPVQGAKFFQQRSNQILEFAKLQQDMAEAQQALDDAFATQADPNATMAEQEAALKAQKDATADMARLQQQMILINKAQDEELKQFNANQAGQTTPQQDITSQIQELLHSNALATKLPGELESAIIAQLNSWLRQLQTPNDALHQSYVNPPMAASQYGWQAPQTTNTSSRTYNMPIYTNNSPEALQQSMAIAQAGMI